MVSSPPPSLLSSLLLPQGEISIHGSFDGGLTLLTNKSPKGTTYDTLGGYSASFPAQMQEFVDAVLKGSPVRNTVEWCMGEVMVAKAIYKSVLTKKWEKTTAVNLTGY